MLQVSVGPKRMRYTHLPMDYRRQAVANIPQMEWGSFSGQSLLHIPGQAPGLSVPGTQVQSAGFPREMKKPRIQFIALGLSLLAGFSLAEGVLRFYYSRHTNLRH